MGKSLTRATVLVVTMLLAFPVFAAKGGNKGKPGGGGDDGGANCDTDALFPALIYPEDSAGTEHGTWWSQAAMVVSY